MAAAVKCIGVGCGYYYYFAICVCHCWVNYSGYNLNFLGVQLRYWGHLMSNTHVDHGTENHVSASVYALRWPRLGDHMAPFPKCVYCGAETGPWNMDCDRIVYKAVEILMKGRFVNSFRRWAMKMSSKEALHYIAYFDCLHFIFRLFLFFLIYSSIQMVYNDETTWNKWSLAVNGQNIRNGRTQHVTGHLDGFSREAKPADPNSYTSYVVVERALLIIN